MSSSGPDRPQEDGDEKRLRADALAHCDRFLSPLADPQGRSVLVVGAGAGPEMLWCLLHGAREVVGIDVVEQNPGPLRRAVAQLGLSQPFSFVRLGIEEADALGRTFDLVLSNNVFEHLRALERAFATCARVVKPGSGRVAIFADPLFYSSAGSHLPLEPWEHLWGDAASIRRRLLTTLPENHPLQALDLEAYFAAEITLNRMRLKDFLEALGPSGLVLLNLKVVRDRCLASLSSFADRLLARLPGVRLGDLAIEGIGAELMRPVPGAEGSPTALDAVEEILTARRSAELQELLAEVEDLERERERLAAEVAAQATALAAQSLELADLATALTAQRRSAEELRAELARVERGWSYRTGRALTWPLRGLRRLVR